jgi:hypothetical protein
MNPDVYPLTATKLTTSSNSDDYDYHLDVVWALLLKRENPSTPLRSQDWWGILNMHFDEHGKLICRDKPVMHHIPASASASAFWPRLPVDIRDMQDTRLKSGNCRQRLLDPLSFTFDKKYIYTCFDVYHLFFVPYSAVILNQHVRVHQFEKLPTITPESC